MDSKARCNTAAPLVVPEIVTLPDEIDVTNAPGVGEELLKALGTGAPVVIADMTTTVFCDSRGLRHLLLARDRAETTGAEVRLVIQAEAVLRILHTTGVDQLFRIYPSVQSALADSPG
jgi:anti-anti-sigma factor